MIFKFKRSLNTHNNASMLFVLYVQEKRHEDVKSPAVRQSKFATLTSYFSAKVYNYSVVYWNLCGLNKRA